MGTDIRIALIGAGSFGRIHGLGVQAVNRVFAEGPRAVPAILVDKNRDLAARQAAQLGFGEWSDDWLTEDYLADPDAPFTWRLDASRAGRCGALGNLGWHIVAIARQLCGPVVSLAGLAETGLSDRQPVLVAKAHEDVAELREIAAPMWLSIWGGSMPAR